MDEKYRDCTLETDDIKFIWGVKSWDDLSGKDVSMWTMNDIDITYDKKEKKYMLGIETAYMFKTHAAKCEYFRDCLKAFTKYMDDNGLNKNEPFRLFMSNPCTSMVADTIEELYTNFKIFVDGFCNQDIDIEEKYLNRRNDLFENWRIDMTEDDIQNGLTVVVRGEWIRG